MNTVNLPLALGTVILRRFIDKFRTTQGAVILKTTSPWFMETSLFKSCMYAYMFGAGLYYTIKHMQRGTIVTLARKCSEGAFTIKDRYVRRGNYTNKNKSSLVKNLVRGREGQQRALKYMASMTTPETVLPPSSNVTSNNSKETGNVQCQNFQFDRSYVNNPYFEPSGIGRNSKRYVPFCKQRYITSGSNNDTLIEQQSPDFSPNYETTKITRVDSKEISPVDIETISISDHDDSKSPSPQVFNTRRRKKQRNCLTLRGRKVLKNDLTFHGDKIVRKTRSGKVYGFQTGMPRGPRRKKT